MLQRFTDFAAQQHLFPSGQTVLLAVSGGRDSVVMTHLVHSAGIPFEIAHCNFHLRPGDCDRDEAFVRQLAASYGVPCHVASFDTRAVAAATGESIEEAARRLRYQFFAQLLSTANYQLPTTNYPLPTIVATAHHRDDSIETFFLNLFRGTGIAGLHGIRPISHFSLPTSHFPLPTSHFSLPTSHLTVVRPLLCFSRADIDAYVQQHGLEYVEDHTNGELDARRNRIRHQLMPLLRELYPSVDDTMQANIERLHDTELIYRAYIDELRATLLQPCPSRLPYLDLPMQALNLSSLSTLHSPLSTLLYELLQPYGFSAAVSADIAAAIPDAHTGSRFLSPTHEAVIDRGRLVIAPQLPVTAPAIHTASAPLTTDHCSLTTVHLDASLVSLPLTVRPWQTGDRFHPFGMRGSRLVSDFLKDEKLNLIEKRHVHVAVDADGRIVWVIGLRLDNRFRLSETTTQALRLSVERGDKKSRTA